MILSQTGKVIKSLISEIPLTQIAQCPYYKRLRLISGAPEKWIYETQNTSKCVLGGGREIRAGGRVDWSLSGDCDIKMGQRSRWYLLKVPHSRKLNSADVPPKLSQMTQVVFYRVLGFGPLWCHGGVLLSPRSVATLPGSSPLPNRVSEEITKAQEEKRKKPVNGGLNVLIFFLQSFYCKNRISEATTWCLNRSHLGDLAWTDSCAVAFCWY